MRAIADLLTLSRAALALPFAWSLCAREGAAVAPLVLFALAALTDVLDGRIARAHGEVSPAGRFLDHGADALFLFPALGVLAALGRLPAVLPAAATTAFALYVLEGWRQGGSLVDLVPSRAGAVAGVLNYVVAGLAAGSIWLGPSVLDGVLHAAALVVAALNGAAVLERLPRLVRVPEPTSAGR